MAVSEVPTSFGVILMQKNCGSFLMGVCAWIPRAPRKKNWPVASTTLHLASWFVDPCDPPLHLVQSYPGTPRSLHAQAGDGDCDYDGDCPQQLSCRLTKEAFAPSRRRRVALRTAATGRRSDLQAARAHVCTRCVYVSSRLTRWTQEDLG